MNWFINLKIKTKLFLSFSLVILIMSILLAYAYKNIIDLQKSQEELFNKNFNNAIELMTLKANLNRQRSNSISMLVSKDKNFVRALEAERDKIRNDNTILLKNLTERNDGNSYIVQALNNVDVMRTTGNEENKRIIIPLILQDKREEAAKYLFGVQKDRIVKILTIYDDLKGKIIEKSKQDLFQTRNNINNFSLVFVMGSIIVLFIAVAMVLFLSRILAEPIQELSEISEKLTDGDVYVNVNKVKRTDEVGILINTFHSLIESIRESSEIAQEIGRGKLDFNIKPKSQGDILLNSLASMVKNLKDLSNTAQKIAYGDLRSDFIPNKEDVFGNTFKEMTESLRKMVGDIQDVTGLLNSISSEISASTSQLSAGMIETATSINQTTATVEEVKQTAQISSQKAKYVVDLAQRTAQVSQNGKKSLDETVSGMEEIRKHMEFVSDSVIKLSEQTQTIGEIITAIDGLAEQSNLLAVNAAIEAAKANEHGKGFAVVASEIRKLAEQSKQATSKVRTILSNVQKATNTAVMTTEQGNKTVEENLRKSSQTKEAIQSLSNSIIEAAQASTQISASAHQQLIGMEQIASAMENIKQASMQNTESTKQVDRSMETLQDTGNKLKKLIDTYKL